jgi:hypothetical protein
MSGLKPTVLVSCEHGVRAAGSLGTVEREASVPDSSGLTIGGFRSRGRFVRLGGCVLRYARMSDLWSGRCATSGCFIVFASVIGRGVSRWGVRRG